MTDHSEVLAEIERIYQASAQKIKASLIRQLSDFDLAEEALHNAFTEAVLAWPTAGIPSNPVAWLISTGRFKAVDLIRKTSRFLALEKDLQLQIFQIAEHNERLAEHEIEDDQLRLIFTCCHPALDEKIQIPLTLREVCGLTTEEIAHAFLTSTSTMAQRIVRGKAKIREAKIPFSIPALPELPDRLDSVLSVVYLVFNEGYSASLGDSVTRKDLSDEAIRLARLILELLPDPEVKGLLALMLLHESRRQARVTKDGDIILLEKQNRQLWNQPLIAEGVKLVNEVFASRRIGFHSVQAAISAVHAQAPTADSTDWQRIVALYNILLQISPSPVIELNQAVALAMRDGPEAGIKTIEGLFQRGELREYALAYSAYGELLSRCGRRDQAIQAFQQALALTNQSPARRFIHQKLSSI